MSLLTLWLAVATTGLWIYTARLWRATVNLARDTKSAGDAQSEKMERSIKHAARATEAMLHANTITEKTAERQLRAYLVIKDVKLQGILEGRTPRLHYTFKNVGQTPANEVRHFMRVFMAHSWEDADSQKVRCNGLNSHQSRAIIGSGEAVTTFFNFTNPFNESHIKALKDGKQLFGVFGVVSYRDVFGRRRLLTFKRVLLREWIQENGWGDFISCSRGNHAN